MQSISVFLDIAKFAYLKNYTGLENLKFVGLKNADVSRTQGVCLVILTFFGSSLVKV